MARTPDHGASPAGQPESQQPLVRRRIGAMVNEPKIQGAVGGILANGSIQGVLDNLILPERIATLLALEDRVGREKFEELLALQRVAQQSQGDDLVHLGTADLAPGNKVERLRQISQLRAGVNRAIVEAEIRLRYKEFSQYPDYLDDDVWAQAEQERQGFRPDDGLPRLRDGQRISYTEAVAFAREMNALRFYNNYYYPAITRDERDRRAARVPITRETLQAALMEYNESYPNEPGGIITLDGLMTAVDAMLIRNAENDDSCFWHIQVKRLAQQMIDQRQREQAE